MTDDVKIPDTKVESNTPEVKELSPTELQAQKHGWVPKEEWSGDPEQWRPAREFVERGEMIGKILAQGREVEELKKAVNFMSESQKKQYLAGYNNAIAELKARRDAAIDEGDIKAATQLGDKIAEVKDQQKSAVAAANNPAPTQQIQPSSTFQNWHSQNDWYGSDKIMTRYADAAGVAFKEERGGGGSETEMLKAVEDEVKKQFPNRFQKQSAPNPDGGGRSSNSNHTQSTYSSVEKAMTDEQRSIMKTILKSVPKMTKEQYLKDFQGA